jgi:cysteine synthase
VAQLLKVHSFLLESPDLLLILLPGIGQGRITNNTGTIIEKVSGSLHIADEKSLAMLYELLDTTGLYLGASSSLNVVAAVEMAQKLGRGSRVATILCDGAHRYQSRLFSKKWLQTKGLEGAIPEHLQKYVVLE